MDAAKEAEWRLIAAVIAIWSHTVTHTTYVPGRGYRWQTGDPICDDPAKHTALAIEEGEAWRAYAEARGYPI